MNRMAAGVDGSADSVDPVRVPPVGGRALPRWIRDLDPVTAGQGLLLLTTVVVAATLPLLKQSSGETADALVVVAVMGVLLVLSLAVPWHRLPVAATLVFPVTTLVGLAVLGLGMDGRAMAYSGIFLLGFAYLGLMHPPGTSWRVLPLALVGYLGMADSRELPILVRMTIVAVVWILLAELLSRMAQHNRAMTADLQHSLATDLLTGVGSRRALDERMSRLSRGDTLVLIDLDHFKAVNDEHGHAAGDEILRSFGECLRTKVRPHDFVARYGGEEFVLVLARTTPERALEVLTRVRSAWAERRTGVTFSSGVAVNAGDGSDTRLLSAADAALYRAKASGRDQDVVA
jgi:diguanylate cyclase (GGDEF)-like protein